MSAPMSNLPTPSAEIAAELRTAAHQLAATIDTLSGCTPEQRGDLRGLPMMMLRQADRLDPDMAPGDAGAAA